MIQPLISILVWFVFTERSRFLFDFIWSSFLGVFLLFFFFWLFRRSFSLTTLQVTVANVCFSSIWIESVCVWILNAPTRPRKKGDKIQLNFTRTSNVFGLVFIRHLVLVWMEFTFAVGRIGWHQRKLIDWCTKQITILLAPVMRNFSNWARVVKHRKPIGLNGRGEFLICTSVSRR